MYRPPDNNQSKWNLIAESFDKAKQSNIKQIFILGDFNSNYNLDNSKIHEIISSFNMHRLINEPTHFTETSSSLIDLIISNDLESVNVAEVANPFIPNLIGFHCPTFLVLKLKRPIKQNFTRKIWRYDQGDYEKLKRLMNEFDWDSLFLNKTIDETASDVGKTIMALSSKCIPNSQVTIRKKDKPWFKGYLRKLICQRTRAHKKAKQSNNTEHWTHFRKIRNEVVNEIKKCKAEYYINLSNKIKSNNFTIKDWWKTTKKLLNSSNDTFIPPINHNNVFLENDKDKANAFNEYFSSQSKVDDSNVHIDSRRVNIPYDPLLSIHISEISY